MNNHFQTLEPLVRQKSSLTSPQEFHAVVNVVFHDEEAKHYDKLHTEMWRSLPDKYKLLINDLGPDLKNRKGLRLLDIGCGTGLATQILLNAGMNDLVDEVYLLDTSSVMLRQAAKRAKKWGKKTKTIHGDITAVIGKFDVIIISSVLHHIPDLGAFLHHVDCLQPQGGILITIHDPSSEAMHSKIYLNRCNEYQAHQQQVKRPLTFKTRLINKITRLLSPQKNYIDNVNTILLNKGVIHQPLTAEELWSVTDIHVEGLPYSANDGISKQMLTNALPVYQLISYRTYDFFGTPISNLTSLYQKKEQELSLKNDLNGRNFGSVWVKNNKQVNNTPPKLSNE
jgi:2-polyprenyl-3-methyl-5-hydroxy-6-metoxy-1,4-benzoquinol methylase